MSPAAERLMRHVEHDDNGCWLWTGSLNNRGYAQIGDSGRVRSAHRVSYETFKGPIPDGLQIDHLCRVKRCINPDHLEPVTHLENQRRTPRAMKTHCIRGHALSGPNLMVKPRRNGLSIRNCRTCNNARARARSAGGAA